MVDSQSERIIGLAGQGIFLQRPRKKGENTRQRTQRPRPQSEVWGRVIDQVGSPAEGVRYIPVCDRAADNIEVFCHLLQKGCGWVIRASHLTRRVRDVEGASRSLDELCQTATLLGSFQLPLRETATQAARTATLEVRVSRAWFPRPQRVTPWLKQTGIRAVGTTILDVREVSAPAGVTPLRWELCTDEQVATLTDAQRIIHYYQQRWLIEEFHKSLKTGCRIESRQYQTRTRLKAVAGLLSVVAVRLVPLKHAARECPAEPAEVRVPREWLDRLRSLRRRPITTIRDFIRELAGLGGHLGRKSDGEPGWITLWRGLDKLVLALRGCQARKQRCG